MSVLGLVAGRSLVTLLLSAWLALAPTENGRAFANVDVGSKLENATLSTLAGGKESYLGPASKASVFVFFRPGQAYSEKAIGELAQLARSMEGKPVHWAAIVSSRADRAAVQALVESSQLGMPVLVDEGDSLWGKLGVALHPVAGITDGGLVLRAYQPFNELRFTALVRAQVQHVLGEIDDAALEAVLHPQASEIDEAAAGASRRRKYAETLFKQGHLDRALERARAAVEQAPGDPEGHALVGDILAAQGQCAAARESYDKALALDAALARAVEGKKACEGK